MVGMFRVRFARALRPTSRVGRFSSWATAVHLPLHATLPACFDSAGRVGVHPAAESRHVQRHKHGPHVSGAHSRLAPNLHSPSLHAANTAATRRPLAPGPRAPRSRFVPSLATRQDAVKFNQVLDFDTALVTNMKRMFKACTPSPRPDLLPSPSLHAACVAPAHRPLTSRLPPRPASHAFPCDSAGRGGL